MLVFRMPGLLTEPQHVAQGMPPSTAWDIFSTHQLNHAERSIVGWFATPTKLNIFVVSLAIDTNASCRTNNFFSLRRKLNCSQGAWVRVPRTFVHNASRSMMNPSLLDRAPS
jgi:hypothetical protein